MAEECAAGGVSTFPLTASPLNIIGGVGSPAIVIAIVVKRAAAVFRRHRSSTHLENLGDRLSQATSVTFTLESGIATVTFRGERRLNVVGSEALRGMIAAGAELARDPGLRLLILTGEGKRAFIGGAEIAEMAVFDSRSGRKFITLVHEACEALRRLPVPSIARIRGYCLGAGMEMVGRMMSDPSFLEKAMDLGIQYMDTAPLYGTGKSEHFYSEALAGVNRDDFVLSTKVGRVLNPSDSPASDGVHVSLPPLRAAFDFSRDGVLRSLEESLQRLKLDRVDILFIHDPDDFHEQAVNEAFPALAELRSQGVIKAIGVGMNFWEPLAQFAREADFDCFLLAGRYTLLDQSGLTELLPLCLEKSMSIILGGPYNSGVLASDLSDDAATTYFYRETPPEVLAKARRIKSVCDGHDVPL